MFCKNCGKQLAEGNSKCDNCGAPVGVGNNHCCKCGSITVANQQFCGSCGANLTETNHSEDCNTNNTTSNANNTTNSFYEHYQTIENDNIYVVFKGKPYKRKSKLVAGLLGILIGNLGIHNFYLGNVSIGIIQLLGSTIGGILTCGISSIAIYIWALIEGIMILTGNIDKDNNGIPLQD